MSPINLNNLAFIQMPVENTTEAIYFSPYKLNPKNNLKILTIYTPR